MTRINTGIKPSELSQKHLIAEHREITDTQPEVLSDKTQTLFSLYDDTNWKSNIDRLSEISSCIESCILARIRYNQINLK